MDGFDKGLIVGIVVVFVAVLIALFIAFPSPRKVAELDCEKFESLYGQYFEQDKSECLFEYNDVSISVEFEKVEHHQLVLEVLQ